LINAVIHHQGEMVELLLAKKADPNKPDRRDGGTPLMRAVTIYGIPDAARISMIKTLLSHGADINIKDANGKTVMDRAKEPGVNPEIQQILEAHAKELASKASQLKPRT
jgi:ankyrin repeat protein